MTIPEQMISRFKHTARIGRHRSRMVVTFSLFSDEREHTINVSNFRKWVYKEVRNLPEVRAYLLSDETERALLRGVLIYCDNVGAV